MVTINQLVKALELIKNEHGNIRVECLSNVLNDEFRQHDSVYDVLVCESEKKKFVVIE